MIAVAERPAVTVPFANPAPPIPAPPSETAVHALALTYLQFASACWRGEILAPVFASRLGAYWHPDMPLEPATAPDAVSPHGGAGRGICWYHVGREILGYVPGVRGGYQIPVGAIPRLVECACRVAPVGDMDGRKNRAGAVA